MILVWVSSIFIGLIVLGVRQPHRQEFVNAKRWAGRMLIVSGVLGYIIAPANYVHMLQLGGCIMLGYAVTYTVSVLSKPKIRY